MAGPELSTPYLCHSLITRIYSMLLINFREIILYMFRSRNCQWPIIITTLEPLLGCLKQFPSRTAPLLEYYLIYLKAPRMLCFPLRRCIMEESQTCSEPRWTMQWYGFSPAMTSLSQSIKWFNVWSWQIRARKIGRCLQLNTFIGPVCFTDDGSRQVWLAVSYKYGYCRSRWRRITRGSWWQAGQERDQSHL